MNNKDEIFATYVKILWNGISCLWYKFTDVSEHSASTFRVYATGSSEKWVNLYQSTRSHNAEHINLKEGITKC